MQQNIFLIGPASVGKSTVSELLAKKLSYTFVDIDTAFCEEVALIPDYIGQHGYPAYCERNSVLVDKLVQRHPTKTVFATPSGFLAHEESPHLVEKHLKLVSGNATSVLLLPTHDPYESVDVIVQRQVKRHPEVNPETERTRYVARHAKYKNYGDIQVIGIYSPDEIVNLVLKALKAPI